jgi:hypothetical protein
MGQAIDFQFLVASYLAPQFIGRVTNRLSPQRSRQAVGPLGPTVKDFFEQRPPLGVDPLSRSAGAKRKFFGGRQASEFLL